MLASKNSFVIFTTQQKTIINYCYKSLFFVVNNNGINSQVNENQHINKKYFFKFHCYFTVFLLLLYCSFIVILPDSFYT
jgi:hypothetical protein